MPQAHPQIVCPRLQYQGQKTLRKSATNTNWQKWSTYEQAIAQGHPAQVACWESFEKFRWAIARHRTYPHMRVWERILNTGDDSRYLRGVAGKDTLILSPRESAKSTYLAQWVAYQYGRHFAPWVKMPLKVLGVSYNLDTARPRSRQIQSIIESPKYQKIFPWVRPSKKKWAETEWMLDLAWAGLPETEEQYSYVCAGLTGSINSRRCVVGDTLVRVQGQGNIPIKEVKINDKVLCFNHHTQQTEYQLIEAIDRQKNQSLIEIKTQERSHLHCTPDHLVYTTEGYKESQELVPGDTLLTTSGLQQVKTTEAIASGDVFDIQVAHNHNFFANGILVHNCHLVFLDDLIKSPTAIEAVSVRDAMVSNWETVIYFTRYDGSRAVCLGTRMTAQDIYCTTFTPEKKWEVLEQSALLTREDGTEYSYWEPEDENSPGTPLTRLQEERETNVITFSFQRQNKLIRISEQSIEPGLIVYGLIPRRVSQLVLGVDLSAGTKESNDFTAMVLGAIADDEYWIIDAWEDRIMGNTPKLDAMVEIWDMWKHLLPTTAMYSHEKDTWEDIPVPGLQLWFDSSAYGLSLKGDYEDHIVNRKGILDWLIRPVPASGRGSKLERLRKHTGLFHNRVIKFNQYGRTMPGGRKPMGRLIEQITEFGSVPHDDLVDAFELCVTGMRSRLPLTKGNY